jgi:hypothetical protein
VQQDHARPTATSRAWIADIADAQPALTLTWSSPITIGRVIIEADPDWDHPMESVLMTHPEEVAPFMLEKWDLLDDGGTVIASHQDYHSAHTEIVLPEPRILSSLTIRVHSTHGCPAAIFRVRAYSC